MVAQEKALKMARTFRLNSPKTDAEMLEEARESDTRSNALAGLAVVLAVIVVSLFLVKQLGRTAHIEDCLLSGRTNCDMLVTSRT